MRNKGFFLALLLVLAIPAIALASQFNVTGFSIGDSGEITYLNSVEVIATNDTLTSADSGKVILGNISTGTLTLTLPTAASGLNYKIASINGNGASGQGTIILNPKSTDTFVGCVNSGSTTTFAAGDDLDSPGVTGDSVTIVGASTKWYCVDRIGTWADGN